MSIQTTETAPVATTTLDSLSPNDAVLDDTVLDTDPLAGVPRAVLDLTGCYDSDTAGGCG